MLGLRPLVVVAGGLDGSKKKRVQKVKGKHRGTRFVYGYGGCDDMNKPRDRS